MYKRYIATVVCLLAMALIMAQNITGKAVDTKDKSLAFTGANFIVPVKTKCKRVGNFAPSKENNRVDNIIYPDQTGKKGES